MHLANIMQDDYSMDSFVFALTGPVCDDQFCLTRSRNTNNTVMTSSISLPQLHLSHDSSCTFITTAGHSDPNTTSYLQSPNC